MQPTEGFNTHPQCQLCCHPLTHSTSRPTHMPHPDSEHKTTLRRGVERGAARKGEKNDHVPSTAGPGPKAGQSWKRRKSSRWVRHQSFQAGWDWTLKPEMNQNGYWMHLRFHPRTIQVSECLIENGKKGST